MESTSTYLSSRVYDEMHYIRKWTTKDVADLKDLVAITVNWIAVNIRLHGHWKSMPEKAPKAWDSRRLPFIARLRPFG